MIHTFLNNACMVINAMEESYEQRKEDLQDQWHESMNMPRKMKKKRRKEILLDWSLNEWGNPAKWHLGL